jgi:hypothetical protein
MKQIQKVNRDKARVRVCMSLIFAGLITLLFSSCEGYKCGAGIVKDKQTGHPLDSVFCNVKTGTQNMYTDSTGSFEVCNRMGGCMFGCKDITIEFSKTGYKKLIKSNEDCNGTIFLEK